MAVQVKCAKYTGDPRVIDKKPTLMDTLLCKITDPCDMFEPSILLTRTDKTKECNYFVIGFRKYFKVKEINESNNMVTIKLHEDVLSTWLPRCTVKGILNKISTDHTPYMDQGYPVETRYHLSRLKIINSYADLNNERPLIVVQSSSGREDKPTI